ncbi:Tn3 family transposase [Streptomyces sp. OE57]|uniref:Tn3 family transposase n=1 Tax=Streptomyces lacaronensis TaxID=3379885 RepID=UPI0039B74B81
MIVTFVKGTNMGPYEAARQNPGVSGHELSYVADKHFPIVLLNEAIADLVNAHARLDISQAWGDGTAVAADGAHMDTYLDNLLSETSVRYGKPGGIAHHHVSDTYIALFTRFIPCGVREAGYIIEGPAGEHQRREGTISFSLLLKRLRSGSRKNAACAAFREAGRVMRTVHLLRYLSDALLRRRVTAATNKGESVNRFSRWTGFGNRGVIADNDPIEQGAHLAVPNRAHQPVRRVQHPRTRYPARRVRPGTRR